MSRRAYPILGRLNLKSIEVNRKPLKPVYLRFRILEVGLRTSLRVRSRVRSRVKNQVQNQVQDPGPGPGPGPGPRFSDISEIFQSNGRMNRLIFNISNISLNLASGWPLGWYPV